MGSGSFWILLGVFALNVQKKGMLGNMPLFQQCLNSVQLGAEVMIITLRKLEPRWGLAEVSKGKPLT